MCRFRSGPIYLQPAVRNFDYMMTLDADGYFPEYFETDPIYEMYKGDYIYSYSHTLPDQPAAVTNFWTFSKKLKHLSTRDKVYTFFDYAVE